jgi:hypothetical protein
LVKDTGAGDALRMMQSVPNAGKFVRRFNRGRLIKIVGLLVVVLCSIVTLLAVLGPHFDIVYPLVGYVKGHPEYCTHQLNTERQIRLAFTPYAKREQVNGHQIDPNNWEHERFAHDFLPHLIIVIPYIDYEITQDSGKSWIGFWRYDNQRNESPYCDAMESLNTDNFWVWTRNEIAITHDGGENWIIQDGSKTWDTEGNLTIQKLIFDTQTEGRIIFGDTHPTLLHYRQRQNVAS